MSDGRRTGQIIGCIDHIGLSSGDVEADPAAEASDRDVFDDADVTPCDADANLPNHALRAPTEDSIDHVVPHRDAR